MALRVKYLPSPGASAGTARPCRTLPSPAAQHRPRHRAQTLPRCSYPWPWIRLRVRMSVFGPFARRIALPLRQRCAAIAAKTRAGQVARAQALVARARVGDFARQAHRGEFCAHDTGGHGQRAPAQQHHRRGNHAAQISLGRDCCQPDQPDGCLLGTTVRYAQIDAKRGQRCSYARCRSGCASVGQGLQKNGATICAVTSSIRAGFQRGVWSLSTASARSRYFTGCATWSLDGPGQPARMAPCVARGVHQPFQTSVQHRLQRVGHNPAGITRETVPYGGPARGIAPLYPHNVNTIITCALATVGLNQCRARLQRNGAQLIPSSNCLPSTRSGDANPSVNAA